MSGIKPEAGKEYFDYKENVLEHAAFSIAAVTTWVFLVFDIYWLRVIFKILTLLVFLVRSGISHYWRSKENIKKSEAIIIIILDIALNIFLVYLLFIRWK